MADVRLVVGEAIAVDDMGQAIDDVVGEGVEVRLGVEIPDEGQRLTEIGLLELFHAGVARRYSTPGGGRR